MSTELSLYSLNENLLALLDTQDMVSDELQTEIEREIVRVALQIEKKVDSVSGFIRHCKATEDNIDSEIARLKALKAHYVAGETRCKGYVADIIRAAGKDAKGKYKPLEGETSVMRLQANGGVQALEITDPTAIPEDMCKATITMSLVDWNAMYSIWKEEMPTGETDIKGLRVVREPDSALLRAALIETCQRCEGKGLMLDGSELPCPSCGGEKTRQVPGARLLPRVESLRVI